MPGGAPSRAKPFTGLAGVCILALVMAACGTTAKHRSAGNRGANVATGAANSVAGGGSTSGGQAGGGPGLAGAPGTPAASSGTAASGGVQYDAGGQPISGGAGGAAGTTTGLIPSTAPGVTASTLYVGWGYSSEQAAGDRAIGAAGAAPSYDARNVFNAVADYANHHGGFAGRQVKAYFYNETLNNDVSTQHQAECAQWTQDHKVFALAGLDDILASCIQNEGGVAILSGGGTSKTFAKYTHLIDPDGTALDRLAQVTVTGLNRAKYFTGKLGLVTWDDPNYRFSITNGYLPALSALHITPAQIAYIAVTQQIGDLGSTSAEVSSAITKFKTLGIDHVIIQDGNAGLFAGTGLTLEWMQQAKSQHYYPRYGANSDNNLGAGFLPTDEEDHALSVDSADYDPSKDAGWHTNVARDQCYKIEADAGFPVSTANADDEVTAGYTCDFIFLLQRLVNNVSSLSADSFIQAASKLGTSFPTSVVYGSDLFPGRRDGADLFRNEEFFASCSCLHYESVPYNAG